MAFLCRPPKRLAFLVLSGMVLLAALADAIIGARPFKAKTGLVERRIIPPSRYEKIAGDVTIRSVASPPARPPAP